MTPLSTTGRWSTGPRQDPPDAGPFSHASETICAYVAGVAAGNHGGRTRRVGRAGDVGHACHAGAIAGRPGHPDPLVPDERSRASGPRGGATGRRCAGPGGATGRRCAGPGGRPPLAGGYAPVGPAGLAAPGDALRSRPPGRGPRGGPGRPGPPVAPGRVSFAGRVAGRGAVAVELAGTGDPPLRTTFTPVRATVRKGDEVAAGEVLGTLEADGSHCPTSCLHWGLLRDRTYLDPLSLLPSWLLHHAPSRLLPVPTARRQP